VGLIDALIAAEGEVKTDDAFARLRDELRSFTGIETAEAPPSFVGQLRDYQREGLGWMNFLRRFGFGGCLADDMGLGKTVQALALLEARRTARNEPSVAGKTGGFARASLVVVPRSLVFHWKREAARFAPELRVLEHAGAGRRKPGAHFSEYDIVLTTYGTLRRDALQLKDQRFDYCVLDEAQAIKNSATLSAKAARLVRADHRLAMSGTPVENHLGELWSLFEFLNPGMLGNASRFGGAGRNPDEPTREILSRALRPFILRRTKEQVARELPEKTEQTLYCDLEPREKRLYDELRDYYRTRLLRDNENMSKIKFQALEALLRLRQAACHPGLIDKKRTAEPSAKVDTLIAQLEQVIDEGHKALVFSQFTSLLAIVRQRLDDAGIRYSYLDGRTRDRQARVDEFQNDPELKLFLISLRAGGLGLNLHAAEYVYLLDPWWNPAVEAQAINRAHRIGQTRRVFAYRLIARDTVEEKVLELQRTKQDLAEAIVTGNNSLIQTLTREDLQLLLS
jgi:SNF2 family DNA or RNA helicase